MVLVSLLPLPFGLTNTSIMFTVEFVCLFALFYVFAWLLLLLLLLLAAQVLARSSLGIEFAFCFLAKMRYLAGYTVQKMLSSPFRIVFLGVFLCESHFASVVTVFLPTLDFLHMPA